MFDQVLELLHPDEPLLQHLVVLELHGLNQQQQDVVSERHTLTYHTHTRTHAHMLTNKDLSSSSLSCDLLQYLL